MTLNEKKQKLLNSISEDLSPIILKDPDIIKFIQQNELTQDEGSLLLKWLICACINIRYSEATEEVRKSLGQDCGKMLVQTEAELEKNTFDDVRPILVKLLQQNIGEWFEELNKKVNNEDKQQATQEEPVIITKLKMFENFLRSVIAREDDAEEFLTEFGNIDKDYLLQFLAVNVLRAHMLHIINGDEESGLFNNKEEANEVAKLLEKFLNEAAQPIVKELGESGINAFNERCGELLSDHYKEFVKKTYKYLVRAAQQQQQNN